MPTLAFRPLLAVVLCSLLLPLGGCSRKTPSSVPTSPEAATTQSANRSTATEPQASLPTEETESQFLGESASACTDPQAVRLSEQNRANCYHLQPAKTVLVKQSTGKKASKGRKQGPAAAKTTTKSTTKTTGVKQSPKAPAKGGVASKTATTGKGSKTTATVAKKGGKQSSTAPPTAAPAAPLVERSVGLCQPQSLIYARCRTGIKTCQMGDTSPVEWFACARKNGTTTATPVAGSVIVIDTHKERRIYTGHPAYVEEVHRNADGTWKLRISHTNYDRKCHLDLDAQVLFDPRTMTATFQSGPWAPWAHRLRVLGFIVR